MTEGLLDTFNNICPKCENEFNWCAEYKSKYCHKCNNWEFKACHHVVKPGFCTFCCDRPKRPRKITFKEKIKSWFYIK